MSLQFFLSATFIGMALIALWIHVRFPGLAPSPKGTIVHLLVSMALAYGVAIAINAVVPSTMLALVTFFGYGYPALVYMFLSIVWVIVTLQRMMRGALP
jgi:hypothetical protein